MIITLPTKPKIIKTEKNQAVFEVEELYPGYGITLGNAMRRVLLSSLEGAAATSIKIKGTPHEFSTLPNIKEDLLQISLNIKQIRFKLLSDEPQTAFLKVSGQKKITAKDIKGPSQLEVVNKDAYIATLTHKSANLDAEILVEKGFGYVTAEERKGAREKLPIGTIALDALFSPVRKINFEVENMRVGERTDFNRLRIFIETDGSITPQEAFLKAAEILVQQFNRLIEFETPAKAEKKKLEAAPEGQASPAPEAGREEIKKEAKLKVSDLNISLRTLHALEKANVTIINQLIKKSELDLEEIRGLGEKGVNEIKRELAKLGLGLK